MICLFLINRKAYLDVAVAEKHGVLAFEVLVEEAVEEGIGDGRAHGEENANGVDEIVRVADAHHAHIRVA